MIRPGSGIEPRVTLVGGEFSHQYTIPAPQDHSKGFGSTCQMGSDLCTE